MALRSLGHHQSINELDAFGILPNRRDPRANLTVTKSLIRSLLRTVYAMAAASYGRIRVCLVGAS